jgi:UDP-glucuronate decarboxylase
MGKNILITGGAGFIGSNLIAYLLNNEADLDKLICIDNFYTGSEDNIKSFFSDRRFLFIKQDIISPFDIDVGKIDEIYHLAAPASPKQYQKDPIYTLKVNFIGTLNILEIARKYESKFLLASTSEVYGNPLIHPQKEDYFGNVNPIGPRACYDEGKRVAETLTMDYKRKFGVRVKIVRIFNTYGPNMEIDDGRVISNFIVQALSGNPITVYGDGKQTRSFCYVDDLVLGMHLVMLDDSDFSGPVNLGNDEEYEIIELANIIMELIGKEVKIVFEPLPVDDPIKRKPDLSLAKKRYNYIPKTELRKGLLMTIDYFKNRIKRAQWEQ